MWRNPPRPTHGAACRRILHGETPVKAELIQIYPAGYTGRGTLLLNDRYEATLDFSACLDVPGGSVILPLAQPMEISSLRISLAEEGALGEVVVLSSASEE